MRKRAGLKLEIRDKQRNTYVEYFFGGTGKTSTVHDILPVSRRDPVNVVASLPKEVRKFRFFDLSSGTCYCGDKYVGVYSEFHHTNISCFYNSSGKKIQNKRAKK